MKITIREMDANDREAWIEMRAALWPEDAPQAHTEAIDELLTNDENWGFIAETLENESAGFAEVAIRKYANGCDSRPVAFLEGIWVKPELRRQRIGAALTEHAEAFLTSRGFRELGSDTQIDNRSSQDAHLAWGVLGNGESRVLSQDFEGLTRFESQTAMPTETPPPAGLTPPRSGA